MQTKVRHLPMPPGLIRPRPNRRIRSNAGHSKFEHQLLRAGCAPADVPGFAREPTLHPRTQPAKERSGPSRIEFVRRRELDEQRPERSTQPLHVCEKLIEIRVRRFQRRLMRDRPGHLDAESKASRNGVCPTFVGGATMRAAERRIDLDRRKSRRVALQVRTDPRKGRLIARRNRPSRHADENLPRRCPSCCPRAFVSDLLFHPRARK